VPANHFYRANGKVLLSGEYLVMDGALALGLPLSMGQALKVKESTGSEIIWESFLPSGEIWFSGKFDLFSFDPIKTSNEATAETLKTLFEAAVRLNSDFLSKWKKYSVSTFLDFEPDWGLGSSSTLISCLADWADVDSFDLLQSTMGGSGYDVACAKAEGPIFYRLGDKEIEVNPAEFLPSFRKNLYFVYLGQKQFSADAIKKYKDRVVKSSQIEEVSAISRELCEVNSLQNFESLLKDHEMLVSEVINLPRIRDTKFEDFWGEVKSLGAWGGDFIMITSERSLIETKAYFESKGYPIFFTYDEIALQQSVETSS